MAYEYQNFATLGVNLNRQKYGALDISQVFNSQADLNYYISKGANTEGVSEYWYKSETEKVVPYPYAGQYVALVNNSSRVVTAYILQEKEDGTFETKEVGKLPTGDGKTIEVSAEGQISLKTANDTPTDAKTYNLAYKNGELTWAEVNNATVEGLQSSIASLDSAVAALQTTTAEHAAGIAANKTATETNADAISGLDTRMSAAEGSITAVKDSVSAVDSELSNRYTKDETYTKAEVNSLISSEAHFNTKVVESIDEVTDPTTLYLIKDDTATGNDHYREYLLIEGVATLIGDTSTNLDNYVQTSTLEDYAKASELVATNSSVADLTTRVGTAESEIDDLQAVGTDLSTRIEALESVGSEKNIINSVKVHHVALTVAADRSVDIPLAGVEAPGVVQSSTEMNEVAVDDSTGKMTVNSLHQSKIVQSTGDVLILDCGHAD